MNKNKLNKIPKIIASVVGVAIFLGLLITAIIFNSNAKKEASSTSIDITDEVGEESADRIDSGEIEGESEEIEESEEVVETDDVASIANDKKPTKVESTLKPKSTVNSSTPSKSNASNKPNTALEPSANPKPSTSKPSTGSTPSKPSTPTPPPQPTQAELNNSKRIQIQNTYGVTVKYGNEMSYYRVGSAQYDPVKLTDDAAVDTALSTLNAGLARYPSGFLREMRNFGMNLTIYLVHTIGGSMSGLTDHQVKSNVIMTLNASGSAFESMLHHEMMHYIDAYLDLKMYGSGTNVCSSTEALNPEGFVYDGSTAFTYPAAGVDGAYSVNSYGKTNCKEDRAEIFRSMMRLAPYPYVFQKAGTPINAKAKLINSQIEQYFSSVPAGAKTEWNRFVY